MRRKKFNLAITARIGDYKPREIMKWNYLFMNLLQITGVF